MSITLERDGAGTITGAYDVDNPTMRVSEGIAQTIANENWLGAEIAASTDDMTKQQLPSGVKIAVLRGGARVAITWSQANGIQMFNGDAVPAIEDLYNLWQSSETAAAAAQAAQQAEEAAEAAAPAPMPAPTSREHVVQAGQTLDSISAAWYGGSTAHAGDIFNANRDRMITPDSISTGMTLVIPELPAAAPAA